MPTQRVLQVGAVLWAVVGGAVAVGSVADVNADAEVLVGLAAVAGPLAALGAALQLGRGADRSAGALLVLSALVTPTFFAYVLNLPALVVGLVLLAAPRERHAPSAGTG